MAGWDEAAGERGWLVHRPLLGQPVGAVGGPCGWNAADECGQGRLCWA